MHDGVKTRGLNDDLKRWQMRVAHTCAAQKKQRTGNARLLNSTTYLYWKVLAKRWCLIKNLKNKQNNNRRAGVSEVKELCWHHRGLRVKRQRWMQRSLCFCLKFTCTVGLLGWWIIQTCYSRLHYFLYLSYKNKQTKPLVLIVCFLCHLTYIISNKYSLHVQFGQRNNYIFHKLLTFTECNVSTNKLTLEIKNKDDKKWSTEFFYKHYEISFGQSVPKVMR